MALGVERRDVQLDHVRDRGAWPGRCAISSNGCTPFIASIVPPGASRCSRLRDEVGEVGERARDDDVEGRCRVPRLDALADDLRRWPAPVRPCAWRRNAAFLWLESSSVTAQVRARDGERNAGQSGAGAHVEQRRARRRRAAARRGCRAGAATTICSGLAHRGEVVDPVPLLEQAQVGDELRAARPRRARVPAPRAPRRGGAASVHALLSSARARSASARASGAPAAAKSPPGVTPWMRAAWPSVSGRCWRELLLHFASTGRAPTA